MWAQIIWVEGSWILNRNGGNIMEFDHYKEAYYNLIYKIYNLLEQYYTEGKSFYNDLEEILNEERFSDYKYIHNFEDD